MAFFSCCCFEIKHLLSVDPAASQHQSHNANERVTYYIYIQYTRIVDENTLMWRDLSTASSWEELGHSGNWTTYNVAVAKLEGYFFEVLNRPNGCKLLSNVVTFGSLTCPWFCMVLHAAVS